MLVHEESITSVFHIYLACIPEGASYCSQNLFKFSGQFLLTV